MKKITSKVTSKRQVTLPKVIADRFGIVAGDEIQWISAGEEIRVVLSGEVPFPDLTPEERLRLFDLATARRDARKPLEAPRRGRAERGWTRGELYRRGRPG